jgi:hypothetical protein
MNTQFANSVHSFTEDIMSMMFTEFEGKTLGEDGFTKDDVMKHLFGEYKPGDKVKETKVKAKKEKDPNKPKRALSGYTYFGQQNKDKFNGEMAKIVEDGGEKPKFVAYIGQKWKELSEDEKKEWGEKAKSAQEAKCVQESK